MEFFNVKYDSLKNPTAIKNMIVGPDFIKLQTVNYDYVNSKFINALIYHRKIDRYEFRYPEFRKTFVPIAH